MTKRPLLIGLILAACYYAIFVWRLSFVLNGTRYFVLVDDAMILLDYGRTFVQTGTLAWYPGYTHGFGVSSIFWALLGSLAYILVPDPSKTTLVIQSVNGVIWLLILLFTYKAAKHLSGERTGLVAFTLTAACWPLTNMAVQGWEWPLFSLGLVMAYHYFTKRGWFLFAIGLSLCVIARFPLAGATPTMLKLSGYPWPLMVTRGIWVEMGDLLTRGVPILGLAVLGCWWSKRWLLLIPLAVAILFSVVVGGDVWHGSMGGSRWILATMPLVAVAAAAELTCMMNNIYPRLKLLVPAVVILCLTWTSPAKLLLIEKPNHYNGGYQKVAALSLWIRDNVKSGTSIGVVSAGLVPWLAPDKRYYDFLGFNDDHIAALPAHRAPYYRNPFTFYNPGHLKFAPAWTTMRYELDIIAQFWGQDDYPVEWRMATFGFSGLTTEYAGLQNTIAVRPRIGVTQ